MDAIADHLSRAAIHDGSMRALTSAGLVQFYAFTLVLLRFSGLMVVGPLFGDRVVPANVRILLIFAISFLVTPALHDQSQIVFHKLDANRDGLLTREEVPDALVPRFESLLKKAGKRPEAGLTAAEFHTTARTPRTIIDYAWIAVGEFGLGFVLGLGMLTILSAMQLGGNLIDQQTGLSLGEISNPGTDITGTVTGQFLFTFATTVLLVMQPTGYHLRIVQALVETFQTIPLGEAFVTEGAIDLLRDLVHQSLVLGIEIAAPLLATMSLVELAMGFLGHSVPQINILNIGFPIRAMVSLIVVIASVSGIAHAVIDMVPTVIDALHHSLTG